VLDGSPDLTCEGAISGQKGAGQDMPGHSSG